MAAAPTPTIMMLVGSGVVVRTCPKRPNVPACAPEVTSASTQIPVERRFKVQSKVLTEGLLQWRRNRCCGAYRRHVVFQHMNVNLLKPTLDVVGLEPELIGEPEHGSFVGEIPAHQLRFLLRGERRACLAHGIYLEIRLNTNPTGSSCQFQLRQDVARSLNWETHF
jgi:hypothetical protein